MRRTDGRLSLRPPGRFRPSCWPRGTAFPSQDSNEAKTLAIFSVPLAYSPLSAPDAAPRKWRLGLEVSTLPNIDDETATPTECRPGKGPENTDLLPALFRPRVAVRLGGGVLLDASWIPAGPDQWRQVQPVRHRAGMERHAEPLAHPWRAGARHVRRGERSRSPAPKRRWSIRTASASKAPNPTTATSPTSSARTYGSGSVPPRAAPSLRGRRATTGCSRDSR